MLGDTDGCVAWHFAVLGQDRLPKALASPTGVGNNATQAYTRVVVSYRIGRAESGKMSPQGKRLVQAIEGAARTRTAERVTSGARIPSVHADRSPAGPVLASPLPVSSRPEEPAELAPVAGGGFFDGGRRPSLRGVS
jgi:hypothetical protein